VITMDKPCIYEIRVDGVLANCWSDWFEGLSIQTISDRETIMRGPIIDQAALFGVLNKIHSLNVALISVCRLSPV
jgi:hypothetical protein